MPRSESDERPLIGVNCDVAPHADGTLLFQVRVPYARAVRRAGGRPVLLPALGARRPGDALEGIQGLLLIGGDDLDPERFGRLHRHPEEVPLNPLREAFDLALIPAALERGIPLLAICLGMQELAVVRGGSLIQSVRDEVPGSLPHTRRSGEPAAPRHPVDLAEGSRLRGILGPRIEVASAHRQAVGDPGRGLRITARAPDGVAEGIEIEGEAFAVGVQWHPELEMRERLQQALFAALVKEAAGGPAAGAASSRAEG